jgi:cardiolipin synthase
LPPGSTGTADHTERTSRATATVESSAGLIGKTLLVDPLVRPFSTIKALYGVTLKSLGGFVERSFIENVRLPALERNPIPPLAEVEPMDLDAWERKLDEMLSRDASSGEINFLVDGEAYYDRLTSVINTAQDSIDIRTYIFDNDDVALEMADLLRLKSEDVDVRIMVDGMADLFASRLDSESMPADIQLPSSISSYLTYQSKVKFRKQSNPWFTGDHAKITIVDEDIAFVGGMNIGREYRYDWHDLMMEIRGPVVEQLQYEFDQSWAKSGMLGEYAWLAGAFDRPEAAQSRPAHPVRILSTSVHNSEIYHVKLAAIRNARHRIFIENTYFSDDKILFELAAARRRGVDVRVVLASNGDSGMLDLSNETAINTMLRNGIRVYRYPGMTHVKAAVFDGWACLGSANFDKLSLQVNQEINLGISDPATVEKLVAELFYADFEVSEELFEEIPLSARHHLAELIADHLY